MKTGKIEALRKDRTAMKVNGEWINFKDNVLSYVDGLEYGDEVEYSEEGNFVRMVRVGEKDVQKILEESQKNLEPKESKLSEVPKLMLDTLLETQEIYHDKRFVGDFKLGLDWSAINNTMFISKRNVRK